MRILIQRVKRGAVSIAGETVGETGRGFVILIGITSGDTKADADYLAAKCVNLRVFEDENGKMNLSLTDIRGDALIVSQFTLYADCVKGRRPGFDAAAKPEAAYELYEYFVSEMGKLVPGKVNTGKFGADMLVSIENDGPATFLLEYPLQGVRA